MAQMIGAGPLQEIDPGDRLGTKPDTLLHLLCSQPLAPAAGLCLGQIGERTVGCCQMLEFVEDLASCSRYQTTPPRAA
jgi:hypothetical protein